MDARALRCAALLSASLVVGLAGCGLKGPLTLPSKSEQVTIRGPGEVAPQPASGTAPPAAEQAPATTTPTTPVQPSGAAPTTSTEPTQPSGAAPATPAKAAPGTQEPPKRRYGPLPPPPLPASNPGTTRGG